MLEVFMSLRARVDGPELDARLYRKRGLYVAARGACPSPSLIRMTASPIIRFTSEHIKIELKEAFQAHLTPHLAPPVSLPTLVAARQSRDVARRRDAGPIGAVVVLPQGVAFATIAGMPPEYGLYAAIVPAIVAALFGSSWHWSRGPRRRSRSSSIRR